MLISAALYLFQDVVLTGATVHTASGERTPNARVEVRDGAIVSVSTASEGNLPAGAHVTAGLFDAYTHAGMEFEQDEITAALTPHLRAIDGVLSDHPDFARARAAGVLFLAVSPGDGNVVGGGISIALAAPGSLADVAYEPLAGIKINLGPEALRRDRAPTGPAGADAILRVALEEESSELHRLLRGENRRAVIRSRSAAESARAIDLAAAHSLTAVLLDPLDGEDAVGRISASGLPVILRSPTTYDSESAISLAGRLEAAGVTVAFGTAGPETPPDWLRRGAILAVRAGMSREGALRAITTAPADLYGVGNRVGIAEGREATLVVWDGDPMDPASRPIRIFIRGREVTP